MQQGVFPPFHLAAPFFKVACHCAKFETCCEEDFLKSQASLTYWTFKGISILYLKICLNKTDLIQLWPNFFTSQLPLLFGSTLDLALYQDLISSRLMETNALFKQIYTKPGHSKHFCSEKLKKKAFSLYNIAFYFYFLNHLFAKFLPLSFAFLPATTVLVKFGSFFPCRGRPLFPQSVRMFLHCFPWLTGGAAWSWPHLCSCE